MCKIKIGDRNNTREIVIRIKDPKDAHDMMVILGKNSIPAVLYGDDGKDEK